MKVKLLNHTPEPDKMVAAAARICYDKEGNIDNIMENLTPEKVEKFLNRMMELKNHGTPFEHPTFTFGIEGISRSCSHQLVRHRIASYDQRSQRYTKAHQFDYVVPDKIAKDPAAVTVFRHAMEDAQKAYDLLVSKYDVHQEDARAVLPNACCTSLVMTMNLRSLYHFLELRTCARAQDEISTLAREILKLCKEVSPLLFKNAGPTCKSMGYCPEGHMSCGAAPTLDELLKAYKDSKN